jgi:hypothetical protein
LPQRLPGQQQTKQQQKNVPKRLAILMAAAVDADSHLKLLPASTLDINKYLSTLICYQLAYSSSLK